MENLESPDWNGVLLPEHANGRIWDEATISIDSALLFPRPLADDDYVVLANRPPADV